MKTVLWLVVLYEAGVGIAELVNAAASSSSTGAPTALTSISQLPSAGTLVTSVSVMTGGVIDLAVAAGIYYFGLRKKL